MSDVAQASAFLAAIVQSSDDAIIAKDLNGVIRSCNPAAERLFGYAAEELIGRSVRTLIPADRQHEEMEILSRLSRGERIGHFETVRVRKNGQPIEVSLSISPVRDEHGKVVAAAKIVRDVTERNRVQRALAEQREWFRVTLASIGDAVITCDSECRVSYMNAVAENLTGWPSAEAIGKPLPLVFNIANEETREPIENPVDKVFRFGSIQGLANHTYLIRRDGTECPIADSAAPIRYDDGTIVGAVLVFHDITQRRGAEIALAQEREWLETTLRSVGDAVIATDLSGCIVFMNPVAEVLTGVKAEDARGRPCADVFRIFNEFSRDPTPSPVDRVLREGMVVGLANHTILIAADGTERPIDDSGAPIRGEGGQVKGVVLVFRDVTERRRMERERNAAAAERDELLASERAARSEAERANRAKDDFVATVSHELRTPLNAILGWTEMLRIAPTDPQTVQRAVDVIARNTRVQAQLVSDLLDLSRIVSGKMRIEYQDVDPALVVENALQTIAPSAAAKSIHFAVNVDPELGVIKGDPDRLQQVVWNLLSNAVKFTPQGGAIRVDVNQRERDVEIVVADTGVGISRDLLPSIFDRFRQGDSPTTRKFGGLGIGLSIVRHLVDLHRGRIRAESAGEGKGSTFTLSLPLSDGPEARRSLPDQQHRRDTIEETASLDRVRVLVVEDDADTMQMIRTLLENRGAHVSVASNASEALAAIEHRPDLIVCDIGLPGMDGYELIRRIRSGTSPVNRIPAIALTAFARAEDRTRALRAGFQNHLSKPVEPTELIATISSFRGLLMRDGH